MSLVDQYHTDDKLRLRVNAYLSDAHSHHIDIHGRRGEEFRRWWNRHSLLHLTEADLEVAREVDGYLPDAYWGDDIEGAPV